MLSEGCISVFFHPSLRHAMISQNILKLHSLKFGTNVYIKEYRILYAKCIKAQASIATNNNKHF